MTVPDAIATGGLEDPRATAEAFVAARLAARSLGDYPGILPQAMAQSYAIQDIAIGLFPDTVVGWKVGGVPPALQPRLGIHRLAGAIFARNLWSDTGGINDLPAISGGFAAAEAEFIVRIGGGVDPAQADWTLDQAIDVIDTVLIGVELAGSPLAAINDLGSAVVASDFGNNAGLLVGAELTDWRARLDTIEVETTIDGVSVGSGGALSLAGGAIESVRFLLEHCARWGRPLTEGTLVSTGAVTGVHRIYEGSTFTCAFKGVGVINGRIVSATA
ncbi:2-keto-4-pentenoate hydratase [soil metagenome]